MHADARGCFSVPSALIGVHRRFPVSAVWGSLAITTSTDDTDLCSSVFICGCNYQGTRLLRAKSHEGIDSSRAAGRNVARDGGHQSQNPGNRDVSGWIAGPDFVKQASLERGSKPGRPRLQERAPPRSGPTRAARRGPAHRAVRPRARSGCRFRACAGSRRRT
jgi:hypothetical protein